QTDAPAACAPTPQTSPNGSSPSSGGAISRTPARKSGREKIRDKGLRARTAPVSRPITEAAGAYGRELWGSGSFGGRLYEAAPLEPDSIPRTVESPLPFVAAIRSARRPQMTESLVLSAGDARVEIAPAVGGAIARFVFGDVDVLRAVSDE